MASVIQQSAIVKSARPQYGPYGAAPMLAVATSLGASVVAYCADGEEKPKRGWFGGLFGRAKEPEPEPEPVLQIPQSKEQFEKLSDQLLSQFMTAGGAQKAGFGFGSGFISAFALKRITGVFITVLGTIFIIFQGGSHLGWVKVDWNAIAADLGVVVDVNDDGVVDEKDYKIIKDNMKDILSNNLPSSSGFGTGFLLGLRY